MSVSYAVDFAALHPARPARDDARRGRQRVEPVHVPDEDAEPAVPHALQHGVPGDHGAGGRLRVSRARRHARARSARRRSDIARPLFGAATDVFRLQHRCSSRSPSACRRASRFSPVWNQNFLWSAPSYFVGAGVAPCGAMGAPRVGHLARAAACRAALSHLSHLQGLPRPHRRRAAARAGDGGSAPRDDRGAGARHRREGSDGAVAHPPRAGLRRRPGPSARHAGQRDSGRQDRGAAARHRQARRARAHPVEARSADAGRVPEDPHSSAGRRGDHQRRALPVSGRAAHPEPPRALGRQGLSAGSARATRSRSARAFCRSSITSTR